MTQILITKENKITVNLRGCFRSLGFCFLDLNNLISIKGGDTYRNKILHFCIFYVLVISTLGKKKKK